MIFQPKKITLDKIADVIGGKFKASDEITCYVGSNAATPTASLEALTAAIKSRQPRRRLLKWFIYCYRALFLMLKRGCRTG